MPSHQTTFSPAGNVVSLTRLQTRTPDWFSITKVASPASFIVKRIGIGGWDDLATAAAGRIASANFASPNSVKASNSPSQTRLPPLVLPFRCGWPSRVVFVIRNRTARVSTVRLKSIQLIPSPRG